LRLHPRPGASRTVVVETDDPHEVVATLARSPLQPSAVDVLHAGRVALLFEGGPAGVDDQVQRALELVGGRAGGDEVWAESRSRQAAARGCIRFAPGALRETLAMLDEAVVRASAGVAY